MNLYSCDGIKKLNDKDYYLIYIDEYFNKF